LSHDDLLAEIAQISSRMVGLSFSGEHSLEALSQLIVALHICAPHLSIVICGQEVEDFRPVLELMGVDGIAVTMEDARAHFTRLSQDKT
jgi:hypothetical protein